jgi:ribosomal protein S18 acetylase RimI-like enzyme
MEIRTYRAKDRAQLIDLWRTIFPDDPPHNEPSRAIDAKLAVDDLIIVAEQGGRLVGACMAGYDGHRGWLYALAVLKEHRRHGTGARLVTRAVEVLKELGCIKVNLQVRTSNKGVAAFYRSLGFATEDRLSMGMLLE